MDIRLILNKGGINEYEFCCVCLISTIEWSTKTISLFLLIRIYDFIAVSSEQNCLALPCIIILHMFKEHGKASDCYHFH